MECIIVVTTKRYSLWDNALQRGWSKDTICDVTVRQKDFNGNKVLLLCQATSEATKEREWIKEVMEETTRRVIIVAKHFQEADIYIAAHSGVVDWKSVRQKLGKRLKGGADFSHEEDDRIYKIICDLIEQNEENKLQLLEILKEIIKKKYKPLMAQNLSVLKHHLAFLFLPIDIDAQGFIEAEGKAQCYWRGDKNPYIDDYLKDLWEQAKRLVYGAGQQDTVEKVVSEAKEKASDAGGICQAWEKVKTLLPDNEPPEVITQIFQDLGEAGSVDLEELKCHWEQFHNWLVSLCEAMDKLRDEVEKLEQAK